MMKKVFFDFFFFSANGSVDKKSSYVDKKDTSIAGLRMFVAFLVFAKPSGTSGVRLKETSEFKI